MTPVVSTQLLRAVKQKCLVPSVAAAGFHTTARRDVVFKSLFPDVQLVDKTIPEYVLQLSEGPVSKYGDKVALATGPNTMTYNQLKQQVLSFAQSIQQEKKGTVVGISLPNCPEFVVSVHGALAAGAVVSPVNPASTAPELAYQLKDSAATVMVTTAANLQTFVEANQLIDRQVRKVLVVGGEASGSHTPFEAMLENDGSMWKAPIVDVHKDTALLPYSSGTTGKPKGVVLSHFNMVSNVIQVSQPGLIDMARGRRVMGMLPFYHIYGKSVILNIALVNGCFVRCMPVFDPIKFLTHIQTDKLDMLPLVPPVILMLAKHPVVDKFDLSSVTDISSGAAPLSKEVATALRRRLPGIKVIRQGFGMTEMSPVSHCDYDDSEKIKDGSCGVLVSNTTSVVLDMVTGEQLGYNQSGELCCKGPQVMLRYHNNPAATSNTIDRDGWLHTGDIGYMSESGHLFIEDRLKELIKVKGMQVAPAELEGVLLGHDKVLEACVVQKADERAGELPKAFVVLKPGCELSESDLMAWTNKQLSKHKHLVEIEYIASVPKSPAGKVLRRILRQQVKEEQESRA